MRLLHITPAYYPATYWGGPIFSTHGLCNAVAGMEGVELKVLTTDSAGLNIADRVEPAGMPTRFAAGYEVYYCHRTMGMDFAPEMFRHLFGMVRWANLVHLTGVYSSPTIPTLLACRQLGRPVVWSPRGSLQRWQGTTRPFVKRVWEAVCGSLVTPGRCVLHVTSENEAHASAGRIRKARIALIPNGIEIPQAVTERVWKPGGKVRLLFLGRLHPIKGIENLLTALAMPEFNSIPLTICGDGELVYKAMLERKVTELGLGGRAMFLGHVTDEAKRSVFTEADICVVPSFTENFGMVVAESLAHGVPVIVSKGAPWSGVEAHGCGLWVENTPDALAAALRKIDGRDLAAMGQRGRDWMGRDYAWDAVAARMHGLYMELTDAL